MAQTGRQTGFWPARSRRRNVAASEQHSISAMIVSPRRNFIFAHIPKTGGTAMALALEARAMADDLMLGDTPKARRRGRWDALPPAQGRLWKHSSLADIAGAVPDDLIAAALRVTLVRNPWDRVVSYYHWLRVQRFPHPQVDLAKSTDFAGFVTHPSTRSALAALPARHYLTDATGSEGRALYIRLEHFADDAKPFFDHLGFQFDLPRANASERAADWRGYYHAASVDAVAQACVEDIARFGYRFDPD